MSKNTVKIDVRADDKGTLKKVALKSKNAGENLDSLAKSARTADRNLKGTAQASANSTKNFSKMAQGMGGLVGIYASVAASVFAVSAAFEFLKRASDFKVLIQAQDQYAATTGSMLGVVTRELQEASGGMLQFQEAAQAAAIGAAKGFSGAQVKALVEGARKTSAALGRSFQDSFDRLIRGVSKAEPELLDELGITLRLATATEKYGKSIGVAANDLTAYQRSIAVLNEVQEQLNKNFGAIDVEEIVNPFNKLAATFDGVVKSVTQGILPAFEGFANIINRSAVAAVAVFGALFISVARAAIPVDSLKDGFKGMQAGVEASVEASKKKLAQLQEEAKQTKVTLDKIQAGGSLGVQKDASQFVQRGSKSKILSKASLNPATLSKVDLANLKKALKSAEAQYAKSGKITTGIFKGEDIARVRSFEQSMKQMQTTSVSTSKKVINAFKNIGIQAQITGATIRKGMVGALGAVGRAAGGLGKAFNKVLGAAGFIGLIVFAVEMAKELYYNFYDITSSILGFFDKMLNTDFGKGISDVLAGITAAFASFVDIVAGNFASLVKGVLDTVAQGLRLLGAEGVAETLEKIGSGYKSMTDTAVSSIRAVATNLEDVAGGKDSNLLGRFQESDLAKAAREAKAARIDLQNLTSASEALVDQLGAVSKISKEIAKNLGEADTKLTSFDRKLVKARAASTAGLSEKASSLLEQIQEGLNSDLAETNLNKLREALIDVGNVVGGDIAGLANTFGESLTSSDLPLLIAFLEKAENKSNALIANTKAYDETVTALGQKLTDYFGSNTGVLQIEAQLAILDKQIKDIDPKFSDLVELIEKFDSATGREKGKFAETINDLATKIRESQTGAQKLALAEVALTNQTGLSKKANEDLLKVKQAQLEVSNKELQISLLKQKIESLKGDDLIGAQNQLGLLNNELAVLKEKSKEGEYAISDIGKIGAAAGETLQSSMASAFDGLIQGTMTAKEAFASMASSILQSLAKVISELLVVKLLQAALGGTSFGTFLGITSNKDGGIVTPGGKVSGYATGGIASGSKMGYPAILHGTEAVVPLPNGKSIPVEMKSSNQSNNVVVNVSVDNQGNGQTSTEQQSSSGAGNLGQAIARAVQQELQNQKRSGGILNPYGVA
jgi:hypothetical protein